MKIKFTSGANRIGHFAYNYSYLLKKCEVNKKSQYILFVLHHCNIPNRYLYSYYKDKLTSYNIYLIKGFLAKILYKLFSPLKSCWIDINVDIVDYNSLKYPEPNDLFSLKNEKQMYEILRSNGYDIENKKFICVHSRDSNYLKKYLPDVDFKYHNQRDANICNYFDAIYYLISKGYYVFRVGKYAEKEVDLDTDYFCDYSFCSFNSDAMDIFLLHKCFFFIGSDCGITDLVYTLKKPILSVNFSHPFYRPYRGRNLFMYKRIVFKTNDETLPYSALSFAEFNEIYTNKSINYRLNENSPREILNAVKDMEVYVNNPSYLSKNLDYQSNVNKVEKKYVKMNSPYIYKENDIVPSWLSTSVDFF